MDRKQCGDTKRNFPAHECASGLAFWLGMRTRIIQGQPFGQGAVIESLVSGHQSDGA